MAPTFRLGPWNTLADGVHVVVAQPDNVSLGLVVGTEAALLIDTGSSTAQGHEVRTRIAEVTDRPLTHVVVTHGHGDHFGGLAAFDDLVTIGHESLVEQAEGTKLQPPNAPMSILKAVELGGRRVEIVYLGPAHTSGDLIVVLPESHIVFAGDLVEQAGPPSFGPDSHPDTWPTVLDGLIEMLGDTGFVVPGHGDPVSRDFCLNQRAAIAAVDGQVRELVSRGVRQDDAYAAAAEWALPEQAVRGALDAVYRTLGDQGIRPRTQLPLV